MIVKNNKPVGRWFFYKVNGVALKEYIAGYSEMNIIDQTNRVDQIHKDLMTGYKRDFGKNGNKINALHVESIFNNVPAKLQETRKKCYTFLIQNKKLIFRRMEIKLTSYGATEEVTGSCHLLNIDGYRILVDCGMYQGNWDSYVRNWDSFLFDPNNIDAVILTHAHLDHCGRLPKLYAGGYNGPVYATGATIDLAHIVLKDSYFIMDEKAFRKKLPKMFSEKDLNRAMKSFVPLNYYEKQDLQATQRCSYIGLLHC
jgi:predicted metal-dependent RNase